VSQVLDTKRIAERFLNRQSDIIFAGDTEAYLETVSLPCRRMSLSYDAVVETEDQMRAGITAHQATIKSLGINLFVRRLKASRLLGKRYLEAIYSSHHLRGGTHMIAPYEGRVVLSSEGDDWRMIESQRQIQTSGWAADFKTGQTGTTPPVTFACDDVRDTQCDPMLAYQRFLDATCAAESDNDFGSYAAHRMFPYTAHADDFDHVIETPEDMRPFFDRIRRMHDGSEGDRMTRTATRAEFVGADLLVGYHTARFYLRGAETREPVASRMILKFVNGTWRLASVANAIHTTTFPWEDFASGAALTTDIDIQKRTLEWPNSLRRQTPTA